MSEELVFFRLQKGEVAALVKQAGEGGFQQRFETLLPKLDQANGTIRIDDAELGKIIRYLSYGGGGWQNDLKTIFLRSITNLLSGNRDKP